MSTIDWSKIDKFYLVFTVIMVVLAVVVIVTFKTVFSSIISGTDTGEVDVAKELQVNKKNLDSAYDFAFSKEDVLLEISGSIPQNTELVGEAK
jgi:uncharacterized protein YpmB